MKYCVICRDLDESSKIKEELMNNITLEYDEKSPDLVIAVGGDGTIIRCAHQYPNSTIFGIHTGHLGFFANYTRNDLNKLINAINTNTYNVEVLDTLVAKVSGNTLDELFALNEITVVSPLKTLTCDVYIDDIFFERFRGTGLCISTPFGSTAYNKALGGAVIDSALKTIQVTEMAGINSTAYRTLGSPLLLSSNRRIKLDFLENVDLYVTSDHIAENSDKYKSIEITYKQKSIKMAYTENIDFIKRIHRTFLISKD